MKKITKIVLAVLVFIPTMAMSQAEFSRYYIEGDYAMHQGNNGYMYYTLTNIATRGIKLSLGNANTIKGGIGDNESVTFKFDTIDYSACPEGDRHILFWKAKEGSGPIRWQIDSEVDTVKSQKRTDMVKVVVLVLDCSRSLGKDSTELKNCAMKFIDILLKASSNGNIRIGVIGFNNVANTNKNVITIRELNKKSAKEIKDTIKMMHMHNNTAMYYAMDTAQRMINDYIYNELRLPNTVEFGGATMVTFTDGFDNHSLMEGRVFRKGLDNPYFKYVRDTVIGEHRLDKNPYVYTRKNVPQADGSYKDVYDKKPLESIMLVLRGDDVSESDATYKEVFNSLGAPAKVGDTAVYYVNNFGEVKKKFKRIGEVIANSFQQLTCYVPRAHEGRVRWTFDKPHGFFGFSAGGWGEYTTTGEIGAGGNISMDFGFPTKDFRAWGGFIAVKPGFSFTTWDLNTHAQFGIMYAGQTFQYKKAPLLGLGVDVRLNSDAPYYNANKTYRYEDDLGFGLVLRAGMISQKHLYWYADLTVGYCGMYAQQKTGTDYWGNTTWGKYDGPYTNIYAMLGFNIGYRFFKTVKNK